MTFLLDTVEALATPHGLDRYLELLNPLWTVRELRAEVEAVHHSTDDSVTLTLRPTRQWKGFRAGQFVNVTVDIDGVRRTRCYSPASSAHRRDGRIEITVKAHPLGLVSRHLHQHAHRGMVLGLSQADGSFELPDPRPSRVLLVSGGSGITPVLSMLRTLVDEHYTGEIVFLHYAFGEQNVSCLDELRTLAAAHDNVRLVLAFTEQEVGGDLRGLFEHAHLAEAAPWHRDAETFLCGPLPLMQAIREHYDGLGLTHRLHSEDFAPVAVAAPSVEDVTGEIVFARTGTSATNDGSTLLEQAEAAGLNPEFGCRMGICFSCTQVKTSGCTRNIRTGETNSDPDVEVQLCINVPVGAVALDI